MPIDADHVAAQSHWTPSPCLADVAVVLEAVADTIAVTATDTGSPSGPPAFDSASRVWVARPRDSASQAALHLHSCGVKISKRVP